MVILNGQSNMPHHRQNRRRERPGSRTRRTMNRKANAPFDYTDGLLDARDTSIYLPSDKPKPSPLFHQNFNQSWQRWKARQAEEKALAEMDRIQFERDQQRLFGEDVGDDELYRLGILYNDDEGIAQASLSNTVSCDVPVQQSVPMFIIRPGKPTRSRRRSNWSSLPLYLSFSGLSDDVDIARLLCPSTPQTPTIQHRTKILFTPVNTDIPQSLPAPLAFGSGSSHGSHFIDNTISISTPPSFDSNTGDWTLIHTPHDASHSTTPSSEPENWILIDDL